MIKLEFENFYKNNSDRFTREHFNLSKKELVKLLSLYKVVPHTKTENTRLTNLKLYGCANVMSSPQVKEHFIDLYGGTGSPFCKEDIRLKRDFTVKKKYGVNNIFQDKKIKEKIKSTHIKKYGAMGYLSTYQRHKFSKYKINDVTFDSSWEVALYKYSLDNNINCIREPIKLYYNYNNSTYTYIPDFLFNGRLVEIKGNHLLDDKGTLIDPTHKMSKERCLAKQKCMEENDVIIMTYKEIKFALDYMVSIYGKNWISNYKL